MPKRKLDESTTLREWLQDAPFGLTLSAGFFGFFAHGGCVAALEENDLFPASMSGSSAGALVAALWASGRTSDELKNALVSLRKKDFWDPGWGLGLLKGQRFSDTLDSLLKETTFESCRWPLALSVFDLKTMSTRVLCSGELNPAVRASCAYPGLFHPVSVDTFWAIDGGVLDRSGLAGIAGDQRVLYHHIPSRSTWRSRVKRLSGIPSRKNLFALIPTDLPRLGPNQLEDGMIAFDRARAHALKMLDSPVINGRHGFNQD